MNRPEPTPGGERDRAARRNEGEVPPAEDAAHAYAGIPGISIEPLSCRLADLRITLNAPERRLDPAARARVDEFWNNATRANPRLFDGPMLSCVETDPAAGALRCRRTTFRFLACQPTIETGTMQTSVTGVLIARDPAGREHILLARRGRQTRVYPNLWELGPSGGIDPPARADSHATAPTLTGLDVWRQLLLEIDEELGLDLALDAATLPDPPCLCVDHISRSTDVVLPVRLDAAASATALAAPHAENWEYADARWIPVDELAAFDRDNAPEIIPPTRALLRLFGWV